MSLKFIEITVGWRTRKSVASLVLLSSTIVLFGLAAAQNVPPSTRPQLSVTIRPERDGSSKFTDVEVELEIGVGDTESKQPFALYIPVEFAGIKHVADRIENLEARTKDGPVTLDRHDDPPDAGGSLFWRHWVMAEHPAYGSRD